MEVEIDFLFAKIGRLDVENELLKKRNAVLEAEVQSLNNMLKAQRELQVDHKETPISE